MSYIPHTESERRQMLAAIGVESIDQLFADVPAAHGMHMIEVELPLLREVAGGPFAIVPLVGDRVGREDAPALAAELARLDDPKTVFVISVDLSHYYPYDRAVALDRPCLAALAAADEDAVATCDTDATQVLVVMTELAARLGLTPRLITYQNSGDVTGDRSGVVGYGAIAYEERFRLGSGESEALVRLARTSLETQVRQGRTPTVPADLVRRWPRLTTPRGAFVTLKEKGALRGCIGSLMPVKALAADVVDNAVAAAVADTRFAPVQADELPAIAVSVSVLDLPRPLGAATGDAVAELLARTKPGVILSFQGRRSTFLPEVWDELPAPREFLAHLCAKQGSPADCWLQPDAAFQTYATQHIE